ncbi:extracellular solute-binding protein [Cohnella zeiphila]|uniref:Extracellular solute-binding protein n=1 Tax=Cohnella zeiphila TaxID=2761120 RepID=A0A7X0SQK4_9BACL|nr:extracellular solute-binding protein [Cohnella zeiphila]MBB6733274.1 extracellular solute-binding protein [Cohnella zeiphila]
MLKRKGKGLQALALAAVMATVAVSAGCSSDENAEQSSQASSDAGATASASASAPASTASKEKVTLKVEVFDRGNAPAGLTVTDNAGTRYAQKNFGDPNNIKLEFVPVPRSQEVDKLNVLMASGNAPDIVFTYDEGVAHKYMQQGGLTDVGSLIDQYGPNLKSYLGADTLAYGLWDNKQLSIPAKRAFTGMTSYMIRQDWLDKLGLAVPATTEETYQALKGFKDKQLGGQGTIPLGLALHEDEYIPLVMGLIKESPTEEDYYTKMQRLGVHEYPILFDGHKDAIRTLNQWYNEGLISPDFGLDKDQKVRKEGVSTGKVGMYSEQASQSFEGGDSGEQATLAKNVPGGTVTPVDPFTNDAGKHVKELNPPTGAYLMIPKTSKAAAQAVQYLDWLVQSNNLFYYKFNGPEGTGYQMQDGIPVQIKQSDIKPENNVFNSSDMTIISNGLELGSTDLNIKYLEQSYDPSYTARADAAFKLSITDAQPIHYFPKPIDAESKYAQVLKGKYEELLVKSIMAKPADFDKTYDDLFKQYMASGGSEIQKEREAAYKAMKP